MASENDTILIVSANSSLIKDVKASLDGEYTIESAADTGEALSRMTFQLPGLVIADLDLPEKGGIELLKKIRSGIKTKLIPFVMLSGKSESTERIQAIEEGADAFLTYPFLETELIAVVKSKLNLFKEFYLLSITDDLTRLFNRREFIKKFNEEAKRNPKGPFSLAILDIDFFKRVNDLYGHPVGDRVLMQLAAMLKEFTSSGFLAARFGGEEFVILMPETESDTGVELMEGLLEEFSAVIFESNQEKFQITFSAGVAEYPRDAQNASEMLSRADQALYTAKDEGRNRVLSFSPVMARNDRFWEYLKFRNGFFVNRTMSDPSTGLDYLPYILETIANLDFEVNSIGVLVLELEFLSEILEYIGYRNSNYDLENISVIIEKSCELIFPSDTYIGLSDFYKHEIIVLFPSVVDFHFNLKKFNEICRDISVALKDSLQAYCADLSFSSSVIRLNRNNPAEMYREIDIIRSEKKKLSWKKDEYKKYLGYIHNKQCGNVLQYLKLKDYYNHDTCESSFHFVSCDESFADANIFGSLLEQSGTVSTTEHALSVITNHFYNDFRHPLLVPWASAIPLQDYILLVRDIMKGHPAVIMINEYMLQGIPSRSLNAAQDFLQDVDTISLGIDNAYIGNDVLAVLSRGNFSVIQLSENITRKLYFFKDRIKVINGLKVFLDQISMEMIVKGIHQEEDFQVINDLGVRHSSGNYTWYRCFGDDEK